MTPLVQKAVEQQFRSNMNLLGERPEDYAWFDVEDATQQVQGLATPEDYAEVLVLPFEKTAFVAQDEGGIPIVVYARQLASSGAVLVAISASISIPKRRRLLLCELALRAPDGEFDRSMVVKVSDANHPRLDVGKETVDHIAQVMWLVLRAYYVAANTLVGGRHVGATSNKRRVKKGKTLLFEWRTVTIAPKALPNPPKGGTHASPRHHDRRGHWSVSKLGKRYWRRATKVGNPANGVVFHDYQIKPTTKGD